MKFCMIVNPHAGKRNGMAAAEAASKKLKEHGIDCEIEISNIPGDSITLASNLNIQDFDGILAVGGDGTLFEVINGLLKDRQDIKIPVGQIPVGTGNSFIKDLGIRNLEDSIKAIITGQTKAIDLGEFSYSQGKHFFINLLGTGFVSNVAYRARKYKKLGSLSYIFGVLEEVAVLKSTKIEINIDGKLINREAVFTEICNSRYTGGDMLMAPGAKIDDGYLDIIILNKVSRLKLLSLFPLLFKGEHVNDDAVEVFTGKNISLKSDKQLVLTPDGETFGDTPIDVTMHPKKIKMFC
ncbi:MAG: diacylglycerol kinase family lipid kinase [Spirochaetia bacterium]|jgi:diacylglycerol kinase (ATP)|nr:diacylglycerol kinase family lipid kinase [Spirochaetia bacterium]